MYFASLRQHDAHGLDIGRVDPFANGKTFRFETIDEVVDFVVTDGASTNDLGNIIEIDTFGVAMARYEFIKNGRNDRAHLIHYAHLFAHSRGPRTLDVSAAVAAN
jgi:hypothetical protein